MVLKVCGVFGNSLAKRKHICQTNETLFQLVAHIRGLKKSRPRKLVRKMEGTAGNIELGKVRAYGT